MNVAIFLEEFLWLHPNAKCLFTDDLDNKAPSCLKNAVSTTSSVMSTLSRSSWSSLKRTRKLGGAPVGVHGATNQAALQSILLVQ